MKKAFCDMCGPDKGEVRQRPKPASTELINGMGIEVEEVAVVQGQKRAMWTIKYSNDVGPNDEGFWEWWEISDGERMFQANTEAEAHWLCNRLNQETWAHDSRTSMLQEFHDIEQTLGKALGYPRYKDDQKNFPGATDADGVCVGDHVAASLATEAAERIRVLEEALGRSRERS